MTVETKIGETERERKKNKLKKGGEKESMESKPLKKIVMQDLINHRGIWALNYGS